MKVFVTGATGFVGKAIIQDLLSKSYEVKALVREFSEVLPLLVEQVVVGDLVDFCSGHCKDLVRESFADVELLSIQPLECT